MAGLDLTESSAARKHYTAAVLDCDQAIDLQPMFAKAHYRKALALEQLGSLTEALASAKGARSNAPEGLQKSCDLLVQRLARDVTVSAFDEVD